MKLKFELTNEQRKYLGLIPVEEDWELVKLNYKYENIYFYSYLYNNFLNYWNLSWKKIIFQEFQ